MQKIVTGCVYYLIIKINIMRQAKLIVCHHSNEFKALTQMRDGSRYIPGSRESSYNVVVTPATNIDLISALNDAGIFNHTMPNLHESCIRKIAEKFSQELCTLPEGNLAWDEDTHEGFFTYLLIDKKSTS